MSPILASPADAIILIRAHASVIAYSILTASLVGNGFLFYMFWSQFRGTRDWRLPPSNKLSGFPIPHHPAVWVFVGALWFFAYEGFSSFYGVRVQGRQVELLYVWPNDSVLIAGANLLDVKLTQGKVCRLWVSTRDGRQFSSSRETYGGKEPSEEAFHRIDTARTQP